ncbi:helix-turn-helix domain-containing protein [Herbaspirillum frisingense]|uniref:helix-turn-helix domain-containing protein n=1 Tax=Herbaspirillum frisingense TaxID=92645 RepID=UPI00398C6757|nr:helix-turn-helix domain-containing protein [Herbaspirillum frisingense]
MNLGHALKMCRSAKALSLDQLAERTQLSQSYLSMIESNKREPTLSTIEKISKALDVPVPIVLFLASEKADLKGLDSETASRLSIAALNVIRST